MIIDKIENIHRYFGISKSFNTAIRYLENCDYQSLQPGRIEIDGDEVFAFVEDNWLDRQEYEFEVHEKYADIQIIIKGEERFALGKCGTVVSNYIKPDFLRCQEDCYIDFVLEVGWLVVFLPGEHHAPCNPVGDKAICRKLVVKVLIK